MKDFFYNEVKQLIGINQDLTGSVVIIEDIVDTGIHW
jgi:hypoxanthine-guanine phosphoribosyltransferase